MDFKQYPNYKDSGVEWLGSIPIHWGAVSLGFLFNITSSKRVFEDQWKSEGVPFYRAREIVRLKKDQDYQNDLFISNELYAELRKKYGVPQVGDILVTAVGTLGVTYIVEGQKEFYFKDGNLIWLKTNNKCDSRFINYCYESSIMKYQICRDNIGATVGTYTIENAKKNKVFLPSLGEQQQIASFLDSETSRIDNLIAKQEKLIEKLEEHRKSVISHAVTKGLDPNVPMKDSGVEWLGDIPENWNVYPFSYLFKRKEITQKANEQLLSVYLDRGVILYSDGGGLVHKPADSLDKYQLVEVNDFVMNNQQAWRGSVGISPYQGIVSPAYLVFSLHQELCNPKFFKYCLRDKKIVDQFMISSMSVGTIQRQIKGHLLKKIKLSVPPLVEQNAIANFLDSETSRIDNLIAKQEKLIEKLKEYRTSIISHAVTGKIDVRDLVA